ncbi:hypothetical protein PT974_09996 [Cladobotryum mycophilum]|uniref:Uncharacterized protein n=1 Tax=Cladobotryum mycophilum TaxID=491253 RepID=A0ABR0S8T1_9HYPO
MPTTDEQSSERIKVLKKAIDESMTQLAKDKEILQKLLYALDNISKSALEQMVHTASSSRERRGITNDDMTMDARVAKLNERLPQMRENIKRKWLKIHDLEEQLKQLQR